MNFFEYQAQARRRTALLLVYYALAIALIVGTIYVVVCALTQGYLTERTHGPDGSDAAAPFVVWDPTLFLGVAGGTLLIIGSGMAYKMVQLAGGGAAVATALGGRPVAPDTADPAERRLRNVVEEMALASGIPVPPVYVLDNEAAINAFAAGFTPRDAVVTVTRGTLEALTRDELQGVVAHEFSHILNGDMRLNLRLMGMLNGILVIALLGLGLVRVLGQGGRFGSGSSRGSSREGKDSSGGVVMVLFLLGIALWIVGYIGVFFANLIKAAVSRQREFLADASAVQFTRNPGGIGGALKKIGGWQTGSRLATHKAQEASHFFFANGLRESWFSALATHPPLAERIRRLDPAFDGALPAVAAAAAPSETSSPSATNGAASPDAAAAATLGLFGRGPRPAAPPPLPAAAGMAAAAVADHIGALHPQAMDLAAALIARVPTPLREAVRTVDGARSTVYALLLDARPAIRAVQRAAIEGQEGAARWAAVEAAGDAAGALAPELRLPVVDLAMPALRMMPVEAYVRFRAAMMALVTADEGINLFEYAVMRMIVRQLDTAFGQAPRRAVQYYNVRGVRLEASVVLGTLARYGAADEAAAARAYAAGMDVLFPGDPAPMPAAKACSLDAADKALDVLAAAAPRPKQAIVQACAATVAADGVVGLDEGLLLRAVCDALGCPLPPLVSP